jgi:hypothetical protein
MRNIISFKNPCVFQGSKYLEGNKTYFEGWYYKNTSDNISISFIPGISINKNERKAFIQVITNDNSYNIDYDNISKAKIVITDELWEQFLKAQKNKA